MSEGRDREPEGAAVASAAGEAGEGALASPLRSTLTWVSNNWQWFVPGAGGLLLLLHFWRIGFLPSLSFADLGAVLGAFVLFFVVGAMAFSGLMLLPVLMIATWVKASIFMPPPRKRRSATEDVAGHVLPRKSLRAPMSAQSRGAMSAAHRRVLAWSLRTGSYPSFLTAALVALAIYVGLVLVGAEWSLVWTTHAFSLLFAVSCALLIALFLLIDADRANRRLLRLRSPVRQWLLLFTLYLAAWPFLLIVFTKVDGFSAIGQAFWTSAISVPIMTPLVHWLWYTSMRVQNRKLLVPRLLAVVVVMVYSGFPFLLVDATANTLGLGMMRHVDLVLTTRGCDIVHAGWPERVCAPDHREGVEMGVLDDVEVLTRIGSQYYLAPPGGIEDAHLPRITVPASEVLGMVRK